MVQIIEHQQSAGAYFININGDDAYDGDDDRNEPLHFAPV
jgi:hypothetical protein